MREDQGEASARAKALGLGCAWNRKSQEEQSDRENKSGKGGEATGVMGASC